ncbi:MAG: dihydroorotate dehydrogenase [Clostridiales bacterium]|nr:MAG: dihydroorotate dehydrogenase [Clostridiales bacterium]
MVTAVELSGVTLKNPLIAASGTFGYGYEMAELFDINCIGGISFKGTTREPRFGNPTPRIAETPSGMLNAVGLQNPGIDAVIEGELPKMRACFHGAVIANIGGFSVEEYAECCEKIGAAEGVSLVEVNISCPNVHDGGMSFGTSPAAAEAVTKAVRRATKKPVYIKLSPNVTDIAEIARACEAGGADGVSLINTLLGMRIDLKRRRPVLANTAGGLSGRAVLPVALRCVWQVYEAVSIPIIGMGGVSTAKDVLEMMLAGARAVQVGAATLVDPFALRDIAAALPEEMQKYGIHDINEIIGGAHS